MMTDTMYHAKIERFFRLLDADGDDLLGLEDFLAAAARAAERFGFDADTPESIGLKRHYVALWDEVYSPMDGDGDQRVGLDEMVRAHETSFLGRPEGYARLRPVTDGFLLIADRDADGTVTHAEFVTAMQAAFGVGPRRCEESFAALDLDEDDRLTGAELHRAVEQYFCHSDPAAPGNNLFGAWEAS